MVVVGQADLLVAAAPVAVQVHRVAVDQPGLQDHQALLVKTETCMLIAA